MGIFEIVSFVLNLLLGSGMIVTLLTLKSAKKKAEADAKASEINNVDSVAKMWRELAEKMGNQYAEMSVQVDKLTKEVNRLRAINSKIVRLLDRITPENLVDMIEKIKQEINQSEQIANTDFGDSTIGRLQNTDGNVDNALS
jgi:flagellar basal body-associated protein FliL